MAFQMYSLENCLFEVWRGDEAVRVFGSGRRSHAQATIISIFRLLHALSACVLSEIGEHIQKV